jgi:putative oxidoreductase
MNQYPYDYGYNYNQIGGGGGQTGGCLSWLPITLIARLLISALFIYTGIKAITQYKDFQSAITSAGFPYPTFIMILIIILNLFGGVFFTGIISLPGSVDLGRLFLLVTTVAAAIYIHNPASDPSQIENFLKDLAIFGGVLAV